MVSDIVPGEHHQIRFQLVGLSDCRLNDGVIEPRVVIVKIAEQDDPKAVERLWQSRHPNVHVLDNRPF